MVLLGVIRLRDTMPPHIVGSPEEFAHLVKCQNEGVGVLIDWVPAHFPSDEFSLSRFDGTCLYEHEDPRQGKHAEWGTLCFNYGRAEVRSLLAVPFYGSIDLGLMVYRCSRFHVISRLWKKRWRMGSK